MNVDTMITGRFDFQPDPGLPLDERVRRAALMYLDKAGQYPNLAQVNPIHLDRPATVTVDDHDIQVQPARMIGKLITFIGIGGHT